jgi:nitrilase
MKNIKICLVQDAPVLFNLAATMAKVEALCQKASLDNPDLILFPEAFIGGYPKGADFSVRMGYRLPEGRKAFLAYWEAAIEEGDEAFNQLGQMAKTYAVYLLMGCVEKQAGTLYCSTFLFNPQGELIQKHRKLMPTAMERVIWGQGDASTMQVVKTPLGNIGSAICWENYMPLYRQHLYNQHVQLYCAPTVDDRGSWLSTVKHIAMEGRCYVLSCCQFMTQDHIEASSGIKTSCEPHVLIRGGSCIVNPLGEVVIGPVYDQPALITAELDMSLIIQGKLDLDVAGHYGRPDIFNLKIQGQSAGISL